MNLVLFTLELFKLRSFKSQADEVMNLSNCYFLGINSDKITNTKDLGIKVIWEIILMEMKKSATVAK